jgi:hypothetical protein
MVQDTRTKESVIARHGLPAATWIETGTYKGDTTEFLARSALWVFSIEPGPKLFADAVVRFKGYKNVQILNGLSEEVLPALLPKVSGEVCFWLDGHYTDELTHMGPQDTPIADELAAIAEHVRRWTKTVVLIDDVHLFTGQKHIYGPYPPISEIMDWAKRHTLRYTIESDIFIASNA